MDKFEEQRLYERDGSDNKRIFIIYGVVLLVCAALWGLSAWNEARHVPELPGEVVLKGKMSFEEADRKVQEAGYIPKEDTVREEKIESRNYLSSEVFGYKTMGSTLISYGKIVILGHYFTEESEEYNTDNPGPVFTDIRQELTDKIGKEPKLGDIYYYWELDDKTTVQLFYVMNGFLSVGYTYAK